MNPANPAGQALASLLIAYGATQTGKIRLAGTSTP